MRHAQRFLGLILERIDEHDARHIRGHVAIEGFRRAHRIAQHEHQGVRHRARRR